ncbi:GNAT family N-acetyltransferase [Enterococcus sp. LJL51]|uniref:GNAT family N-acetyltransferase n=1 Tax=Enterococcus sp. LJL51 TaxID=3416656 RepID=UPI003CE8A962
MAYKIKQLEALTTTELLEIMAARIAVFVVEQQCPYQEVDELDAEAWHIWLEQAGEIAGYARIIETAEGIQIGRVLTPKKYRGQGYGEKLMTEALKEVQQLFPQKSVSLGAQEYAIGFYQNFGFEVCSEVYLEDDIPHVDMTLKS